MHRIDVPSATSDGKFTEGSPTGGVPATIVAADWLNDLQENVAKAIEGAGISLVKGDYTQLLAAINALASGGKGSAVLGTTWRILIPVTAGGASRNFIIQGGAVDVNVPNGAGASVTASFTFGLTFPNAIYGLFPGNNLGVDGSEVSESVVGFQTRSLSGATLAATRVAGSNDGSQILRVNYIAIGV